jgi:F-type H+-transporting ATPase subunit a
MAADPIHQFEIHNLIPLFRLGAADIHFTNSAAFMLVAVVLTATLLIGTTAGRRLVPTRMQSLAELSYELMADTLRNIAGEAGMKFFPFVLSLFMFILVSNVVGIIPYTFTVASHIIITAALALTVFFTVVIYGFYKNGLHFFKLFMPSGIPIWMAPIIVVIELLSFLARPVSHSVRLFANMLAGHTLLKVFGGFVFMLGVGGVLPLAFVVALNGLEIVIAFLQAYVFAILTCLYINDALHLH